MRKPLKTFSFIIPPTYLDQISFVDLCQKQWFNTSKEVINKINRRKHHSQYYLNNINQQNNIRQIGSDYSYIYREQQSLRQYALTLLQRSKSCQNVLDLASGGYTNHIKFNTLQRQSVIYKSDVPDLNKMAILEKVTIHGLISQPNTSEEAMVEFDDFRDLTVAEFVQFILEETADMIYEGNYDVAEQIVLKSGRNLNQLLPPESIIRGALMHQLGYLQNYQGRYKEADAVLCGAMDLAEINFTDHGFAYLDLCVTRSTNLILQDRIEEAVPLIKFAQDKIENTQGQLNGNLPDIHFQAALVQLRFCENLEDFEQVNHTFQQQVEMMQSDFNIKKPPSPDLNICLMLRCYVTVFYEIYNSQEYPEDFKLAVVPNIQYLFQNYMPDCQDHVEFLHGWGIENYLQGKYEEAYTFLDQSFQLAKQLYGEDDYEVMKIYQRMGMIYALTNNFEYADTTLQLSIEFFKKLKRKDDSLINESILGQAIQKHRQLKQAGLSTTKENEDLLQETIIDCVRKIAEAKGKNDKLFQKNLADVNEEFGSIKAIQDLVSELQIQRVL